MFKKKYLILFAIIISLSSLFSIKYTVDVIEYNNVSYIKIYSASSAKNEDTHLYIDEDVKDDVEISKLPKNIEADGYGNCILSLVKEIKLNCTVHKIKSPKYPEHYYLSKKILSPNNKIKIGVVDYEVIEEVTPANSTLANSTPTITTPTPTTTANAVKEKAQAIKPSKFWNSLIENSLDLSINKIKNIKLEKIKKNNLPNNLLVWYYIIEHEKDKKKYIPVIFDISADSEIRKIDFSYLKNEHWALHPSDKTEKPLELTMTDAPLPEDYNTVIKSFYYYFYEQKENEDTNNIFQYKSTSPFQPKIALININYVGIIDNDPNFKDCNSKFLIYIYNTKRYTTEQIFKQNIKSTFKIKFDEPSLDNSIKFISDRDLGVYHNKTKVNIAYRGWKNIDSKITETVKTKIDNLIKSKYPKALSKDSDLDYKFKFSNSLPVLELNLPEIAPTELDPNKTNTLIISPNFNDLSLTIPIPTNLISLVDEIKKNLLEELTINKSKIETVEKSGDSLIIKHKTMSKTLVLDLKKGLYWKAKKISKEINSQTKNIEIDIDWENTAILDFNWANLDPEPLKIKENFHTFIISKYKGRIFTLTKWKKYILITEDETSPIVIDLNPALAEQMIVTQAPALDKPYLISYKFKTVKLSSQLDSNEFSGMQLPNNLSYKISYNDSQVNSKENSLDYELLCNSDYKIKAPDGYLISPFEDGEKQNLINYSTSNSLDTEKIILFVDFQYETKTINFKITDKEINNNRLTIQVSYTEYSYNTNLELSKDEKKGTIKIPNIISDRMFNFEIINDWDRYFSLSRQSSSLRNPQLDIKVSRIEEDGMLTIKSKIPLEGLKLSFQPDPNSPEKISFPEQTTLANKVEIKYPVKFYANPQIKIEKKRGYTIDGNLYNTNPIIKEIDLNKKEISLDIIKLPPVKYIYIDKSQSLFSKNKDDLWYGGKVINECIQDSIEADSNILAKVFYSQYQHLLPKDISSSQDYKSFFLTDIQMGTASGGYELPLVNEFIESWKSDPRKETHLVEYSIFLSNQTASSLLFDDIILKHLEKLIATNSIKIFIKSSKKLPEDTKFENIKDSIIYF